MNREEALQLIFGLFLGMAIVYGIAALVMLLR